MHLLQELKTFLELKKSVFNRKILKLKGLVKSLGWLETIFGEWDRMPESFTTVAQ
jgi:hypothetical protein